MDPITSVPSEMQFALAVDELDQVALALPEALASAKSLSLSTNAYALIELCQVLRLVILLEHPVQEATEISVQILGSIWQMLALTYSSRANRRARMTMALASRCAENVNRRLRDLTRSRVTASLA